MACEPPNLCLLPFCHPPLGGTGLASVSLCHDACASPTSPFLLFQVCNCDKYLKVPRERMRQLVEGSRQALGDSGAGKRVGTEGWERCSDPTLSPGVTALDRVGLSHSGWGSLRGGMASPATNLLLGADPQSSSKPVHT